MSGPTAIILAAGAGSRLRDVAPMKPLVEVHGLPLISHALRSLKAACATRAVVVVGYEADQIGSAALADGSLPVELVHNPLWAETPNGVSLLAARNFIAPGSLLTMCDHLLSPRLVRRLIDGAKQPLALGVDRRLGHPHVDEADVTRVRTKNGLIQAIGKHLPVYDCYDTGLFQIGPELVAELDKLASPSLSEGVAALAQVGKAQAVDVGDAPWLDVDDARALQIARTEWTIG